MLGEFTFEETFMGYYLILCRIILSIIIYMHNISHDIIFGGILSTIAFIFIALLYIVYELLNIEMTFKIIFAIFKGNLYSL
jgi:hypothetical protein